MIAHSSFVYHVAHEIEPFRDLIEWSAAEELKNRDNPNPYPTTEIPNELKVAKRAWVMFNNPAPKTKPIQFGDL